MCIMVVSSTEKFSAIIQELDSVDVSQIHFYNVGSQGWLGTFPVALVPATNLVICEDTVLASPLFRQGKLLDEAERMNVPVLSETGFMRALSE
jgi:hypothetical protein